MDVRIVGANPPGRSWDCYDNIHVGVQRKAEAVDLVPGDAGHPTWDVEVTADGGDFRGPYVQGRRGERFLYLSWGTVDANGTFRMFRRAKLMLGDVAGDVVQAAAQPGHRLVATLGLTGGDGGPRCAAGRPPAVSWTAEPSG